MTHTEILTAIAVLFPDYNWIAWSKYDQTILYKYKPIAGVNVWLNKSVNGLKNSLTTLSENAQRYHSESSWRDTLRDLREYRKPTGGNIEKVKELLNKIKVMK